jgi:HSP20 family protein
VLQQTGKAGSFVTLRKRNAALQASRSLDVRLDGNTLTIRGEKREEESGGDRGWSHTECRYGAFVRTLPLDAEVDQENIEAIFKKGVLKVRLPKVNGGETERGRIKVTAG